MWEPAGPRFTAAGHGLGLGAGGKTPFSVAAHSSSRGGQSPLLVNRGTAGEATSTLLVGLRAAPSLHGHPQVPLSPEKPEPAPWRGPDSCLPDRMPHVHCDHKPVTLCHKASQAWGLAIETTSPMHT